MEIYIYKVMEQKVREDMKEGMGKTEIILYKELQPNFRHLWQKV